MDDYLNEKIWINLPSYSHVLNLKKLDVDFFKC